MAIYTFNNRKPIIGADTFVSDSALIIGDVQIGNNCYIGHGSILRGDYGTIEIGDGTAVEEGANIHIRPNGLLKIGEKVTIGHGAILHCSELKSFSVIGIGAVIGFDVVIGKWSIIAEGTVVNKRAKIPDEKIAAGNPFKIVGNVKEKHKEFWLYAKQLYIDLAKKYLIPGNFERIK
jgi:carbonic anhydrase/acetyltransferase-like protein (isoleucine patch superfamily)